ncbi:DNA-directed RNA polymerase I subunit RPA43 [Sitodiplosis mosellana]|uniref:DNA-directed RNA polymerase I subunit RPA43 n=1 Tax=Sitodiplosis mosellana TaxID=263140 RepID=UPI0024445770|nr:DNA-directed RNA polymerase I subunit RPA43 [Sitodiplosis mosellana]
MNKTKLKYVKYTKQELDRYVRDKNSCITLTNSDMHVGFPPWGFANFQETLTNIISRDKIGKYDSKLDGIVLEVRNIKVFGSVYPVHDDDPINHINIKANFYVFQPRIGAIIKGVVKHISHGHVAVIIYRVFNVSIRFNRAAVRYSLKINQPISFRIKKFDLHGAMPYIEGELMETNNAIKSETVKKHLKFEDDDENTANGGDSGISTEETEKRSSKNVKREKGESSSDESSSDSDSESDDDSNENLVNELFANVKIKQEKLSDTENKTGSRKSNNANESDDSSDSSSDEEEEKMHRPIPIPIANIKKEKKSSSSSNSNSNSSSSSDSESSDDEGPKTPIPPHKIKKEKDGEKSTTSNSTTFIPRPIKVEPESDVEGKSKFKKPSENYRRSLDASQVASKSQKRKRNSSISEHLDSLVGDLLHSTTNSAKKNKKSKHNESVDQTLGDILTPFQSPAMSSTLKPNSKENRAKNKLATNETPLPSPSKIKQEPQSEDEAGKRKKSKKSLDNSKSLKSIEDDLFSSFLK